MSKGDTQSARHSLDRINKYLVEFNTIHPGAFVASMVAGKDIPMQVNTFWKRFFSRKDMSDLSDLRLDMIFEIAVLMFILAWLVVLNSIRYQGHVEGLLVALPLFF